MHLDELTSSKTEKVHRWAQEQTSLLSMKCYLDILPIGSDVGLMLRTVCEHKVLLDSFANCF